MDRADGEAVEAAAHASALRLMAGLLSQRLEADHSDYAGSAVPCACGQEARYRGRVAKTFTLSVGPVTFDRAYYHCAACKKGFCPRDRALQMEGTQLSPAVQRMTGLAAAQQSFAATSELLYELAGLRVPTKQVERAARALGHAIAEDEQTVVEPEPRTAPTVYVGLDGTGVPMRKDQLAGRPGRQPDGSAKTREVKLVVGWTAESRNPKGRPQRDAGSVRYSAAIESAASRDTDPEVSPFGRRVRREVARRSYAEAPRRVVLGDGAAWIWRLAAEELPGALQIVDLWHAKEHLWEVGRALGLEEGARKAWAHARCDELEQGRLAAVLQVLDREGGTCAEATQCADYIRRNRERMQYATFRAQGLCVGSGVVEAGCKTVVGARLKRAGMRWTTAGANAILALRACVLSNRYEDYWERRSRPAPVPPGRPC